MNRLQKKCFIVTAGGHLLLLLIVVFGAAFFNPKPKADDSQVLDMIPANLIDAPFSSGVKSAQLPPPAPTPPAPKPVVTPPEPVKPTAPDVVKPTGHQINPDMTVVKNTAPKNPPPKPQDDARQQKLQQQRLKAIQDAARNLTKHFSSATEINLSGNNSTAYANYGTVVVSVYHNAWVSPDDMANDNAVVKFSVTIASDGTVINARIVEKSGDANVDAAVQHLLNRVSFIAPFPDGATEKERTYTINFNATRTTE